MSAGPLDTGPDSAAGELDGDEPLPQASVLVVDDLEHNLIVYRAVLEDLGQNLVLVRSGAQALRELLEREFALILLDVNMPDIDGFETAALVRRHRRSRHTPIIFLTSYADEVQMARGYALGAVDFMLSPVVPEVLRSKVQVFVDLYTMQQRVRRQGDERAARMAAESARRVAERNDRRSAYLAHASRRLGASLDAAVAEETLVSLLVPGLAELALVLSAGEDGRPGEGRLARIDIDGETRMRAARMGELPPALQRPLLRVMAEEELLMVDASGLQEAGWASSWRSALAIPLRSARRCLGVLLVVPHVHRDGDDDWRDAEMLEELATRAAMAFENAQLYRSLHAENAARIETEALLQQANRRKDEFLAMLSHELRNPLAPIRNAVQLVRRLAPPLPKLLWACEVMDRQVVHMTRLVEELLDVARISEGKIALARVPVDLRAVIAAAVETAQPQIDGQRSELQVSLPETPVWLHGDFARLTQVVGNLLHNAAKYGKEGGRIELALSADNGQAQIRVRDDGVGIDAELLPHLFELFVQADRSLDRSQGGLGIGLTLVRRLVELHGGRVEASSAGIGQGAEFRVHLPVISAVPLAGPPAVPPPPAPPAGVRVLIVDDNRDAAESIAQYLELEGHEVKTVGDGEKALASLPVFAPQVVLLDIGLPGQSGHEVARAIRAQQTQPILLVAVTGYGQREDRELSESAGFDSHLVKPTDPGALAEMISQWSREGTMAAEPGHRRAGGEPA